MSNHVMLRALFIAAALSATASAQIIPVGPFTGDISEGFETQVPFQWTTCLVPDVFQGVGQLCESAGQANLITTPGWSFICQINARTGTKLAASGGAFVVYTFNQDVSKFGGYFGVNSGYPDATVNFYDVNNNLLGSLNATIPADCSWNWAGFQSQGAAIRKVEVKGLHPYNGGSGGFVQMDDMEIKLGTTNCSGGTLSYCTAGTSANGCSALVFGSGTPSATATTGFNISVTHVEGQKQGILFYGINNTGFTPTVWGSGGTSYLCAKAPLQRTGVQNSGGTLNSCDGTLALDWNNYRATHATALGNPFSAGQAVYAQAWYRDPPSPKTTSLSDALSFVTCP
jgi:hypothetical protein